jgi:putative cell wall-binding protein
VVRRWSRLGVLAALLASVLVAVDGTGAHALPSCPGLSGWNGPVESSSSFQNADGGEIRCMYTNPFLGTAVSALMTGQWVDETEATPAVAMPAGGCGRTVDSPPAQRNQSSADTWSRVVYSINGVSAANGEAILVQNESRFLESATTLLADVETYAKLCSDAGDGDVGSDTWAVAPTDRVAGANRYATAARIAASWDAADVVYIATGQDFPDALGGGPAAAMEGAPILLVEPDSIPATTMSELERFEPDRIVLVGGTAAISDSVRGALARHARTVHRVAGVDRYATAAAVSAYAFSGTADVVYVASGRSYPDPIIAGNAAALDGAPLLLVDGTRPVESIVAGELRRLRPSRIVLVGADGDVTGVADSLSAYAPVTRVHHRDIYARSAALWDDVAAPVGEIVLATPTTFADALAGTPYAARDPDSYLMLSRSECVPPIVRAQIERLRPDRVRLLGGTAALGPAVESQTPCDVSG